MALNKEFYVCKTRKIKFVCGKNDEGGCAAWKQKQGGWGSFSILLRLQDTNDAADLLLLCAAQYFDSVFWKIILEYFFSDIKTSGFIICLLLGSASSYHDTNEVHEDETYYTPQLDYKRKYVH